MSDTAKGQHRFSKISCYLCSEWLDDDEIEKHLFECSQKSVACPDGCGAIVERKSLQFHKNRCAAGFGDAKQTNEQDKSSMNACLLVAQTSPSAYEQVQLLGEEVQLLRFALTDEVHRRAELTAQLVHLKKRLELTDQWTVKVNSALVSFNKLVSHEATRRSVDVFGLEQRQSHMELWRADLTTRFNTIESKPYASDDSLPYSPEDVSTLKRQVDHVEQELKRLHASKRDSSGKLSNANVQVEAVDIRRAKQNAFRSSRAEVDRVTELDGIQVMVDDVAEKQAKTACRLQDALQQAFESEERVLAMAKQLEKYRRETYYTKQRLDVLQTSLKLEERLSALSSNEGRVIWRIDEFEKRFVDSQEHDTMLKGPIFTNQLYGYVLQLEVSLYGIGTWRGRNLIAGLTVLKGPYDPLLQWPCRITGTIRLRDQPDQRSTATDVCKPIVAKRKGQQTDKYHFVYVPHEVLRSRHYVRDDTIFLEVILEQDREDGAAAVAP